MKIKLLSSAVEDLYKGRLFSDIDSLALYAGIHPQVFGYHRMLSKRFPYAVYYRIEEESAVVWRVLDLRRNPQKTHQALRGEEVGRDTGSGL